MVVDEERKRAGDRKRPINLSSINASWDIRDLPGVQLRKNTNQITPRIRIASPVEIVSRESTDGPGSPWRASVGVSTIRSFSLVAMIASIPEHRERLAASGTARQRLIRHDVPA
jgi:hypothetical protein